MYTGYEFPVNKFGFNTLNLFNAKFSPLLSFNFTS